MSKPQKHRHRTSKALLMAFVSLILVGLLAYAFRFQILTSLASILIVDDQLQPADVIFILAGDVNSRPFYAAELFKQGLAPQIVLAREEELPAVELGFYPHGTDVVVDILKELGVPAESSSPKYPANVARPRGGNSEYLMGRQYGLKASVRAGRIILTFIELFLSLKPVVSISPGLL